MNQLLVVDIGNTTTRVGLWDGREAVETGVSSTGAGCAPTLPDGSLEGIALCSVVPEAEDRWRAWAGRNGLELLAIRGDTPAPLTSRYGQSAQLGGDRLCGAIAAAQRLGVPVIVVSLGTATVVDAVSAQREFLGGAITPGISMGLEALHERTALLPRVDPKTPESVIGRNTEECMRVGAVLGTAALVEGLVTRMRAEIGPAKVALTGGGAALIAPHLQLAGEVEWAVYPTLVLEGAGLIWEHHHP